MSSLLTRMAATVAPVKIVLRRSGRRPAPLYELRITKSTLRR